MTIPFDGVPLARAARLDRRAGRPRLHRRVVDRGQRRRRLHAAGAGVGVGAVAAARHRHRPGLHPRARPAWPRASARWPRPRPAGSRSGIGTSSNVIVERWNGIPFEEPTSAPGTWCGSCARRSTGEKVTERVRDVLGARLQARASCPSEPVPILVAALREGMLRLAGREGDGAIINWLSADDVATVAPIVHEAGGGADKEIVARIFVAPDRRRRHGAGHGPLRHRRLPQRAGLRRVPRVARPGRACSAAMWRRGRRATARRRSPPSPTRSSTSSSCTGPPEAVPRAPPALRRQRRHHAGPRPPAVRPRRAPGRPRPRPPLTAPAPARGGVNPTMRTQACAMSVASHAPYRRRHGGDGGERRPGGIPGSSSGESPMPSVGCCP